MGLVLTTAPVSEPVTLTELKTHLRIDGTDEDTYLTRLIEAGRIVAEDLQNRSYIDRTYELQLDSWPKERYLELPRPPLKSVTSVTALQEDGSTLTLDSGSYLVDTGSLPGRIILKNSASWPTGTMAAATGARVRFVAGAGSAPQDVKQAILLMCGNWYANREEVIVGSITSAISESIPSAAKALLLRNRVW